MVAWELMHGYTMLLKMLPSYNRTTEGTELE